MKARGLLAVGLVLGWTLACTGAPTETPAPDPEPEPEPAPAPVPAVPIRMQLQRLETPMGDLLRSSWLHVPDGEHADKLPMVVVLHGEDGDPKRMATAMAPWMDQGVVFLYPSGRPGRPAPPPTETPEGKAGKHKRPEPPPPPPEDEEEQGVPWTSTEDRHFVEVVTDQVARAFPVDPERVYLAGLGEGGRLVLELACSESGSATYAGFAPVAATLARELATACPAPGFPKPVLLIAGTEDQVTLWTGDEKHLSVSETVEVFGRKDECDPTSAKEELLPDTDASDETRVKRHSWSCEHEVVELLEVSGGGHTWPHTGPRPVPGTSRDIDATGEILDLFAIDAAPAPAGAAPAPAPEGGKAGKHKRR